MREDIWRIFKHAATQLAVKSKKKNIATSKMGLAEQCIGNCRKVIIQPAQHRSDVDNFSSHSTVLMLVIDCRIAF